MCSVPFFSYFGSICYPQLVSIFDTGAAFLWQSPDFAMCNNCGK